VNIEDIKTIEHPGGGNIDNLLQNEGEPFQNEGDPFQNEGDSDSNETEGDIHQTEKQHQSLLEGRRERGSQHDPTSRMFSHAAWRQ
jgi:hypothetical protein